MDVNDFVDTSNIIRERTKFSDNVTSKSSSIFSTVSSIDYYYRMKMNNLFTNKDILLMISNCPIKTLTIAMEEIKSAEQLTLFFPRIPIYFK